MKDNGKMPKINDKGKYTSINRNTYEEESEDIQRNERGKMFYQNGDVYEGNWKEKLISKNRIIYEKNLRDEMTKRNLLIEMEIFMKDE